MRRVCVVGAGPSGLTATKTLAEAGLEVDCVELSPEIGGHWVLDNPNGRSAAYRSLTTNTSKAMSRFSDYRMPASWPEFPSHAQVREWLEAYVDRFGFRDRIRTRCEVRAARAEEGGGWRVELAGEGGCAEELRYDALVAASGSYWQPRWPTWSGDFDGALHHAREYRDPQTPFAVEGRRVVVVGVGNTGCELACEIAAAGAEAVFLSARSGTWVLPRWAGERPAADAAPMLHPEDPVPALFRWLPRAWRQPVFLGLGAAMLRRRLGDRVRRLEALGLPPAPRNPFSKRPTVSEELPGCLERGEVLPRAAIERLDGGEVVFAGGARERADAIFCATGYHLRYPYLDEKLVDTSGDDLRLFLGIVHPRRHDLFVVGVSRPTGAFWPIAELQSRYVADLLRGRCHLPSQREIERRSAPILGRRSFNPALYALELEEERRERSAATR